MDSEFNMYIKFNRKRIQDRQIDTLIGLAKGLTANGDVDLGEAMFLQNWLIQNGHSPSPIITNLLNRITAMLEDHVLDEDEASELLSILHKIGGVPNDLDELPAPSTLPICKPAPQILFKDKVFLFTGTCAFGTRKECQKAITDLGAKNANGVTKKLDYLVLGTYVTDSWAHESFGRKIEKAMLYRDSGIPLSIITEEHWAREANL